MPVHDHQAGRKRPLRPGGCDGGSVPPARPAPGSQSRMFTAEPGANGPGFLGLGALNRLLPSKGRTYKDHGCVLRYAHGAHA